jgi:hypothetical protein
MPFSTSSAITPLDALIASLRACDTAPDGVARPAAILWTDPKREWLPLLEPLRERMPELVTLGDYAPDIRRGPAIWLRCVIDRTLAPAPIPEGATPVVYMPGVARSELRAGESCPDAIKPLVELQYRGTVWLHQNGRDWTATGFLSSEAGLGLDLARDDQTIAALHGSLREVGDLPLSRLEGRRLEADDFNRLLESDPTGVMLRWLNDPVATPKQLGDARWRAFRAQSQQLLEFDPDSDGEIAAGERLGRADGAWAQVWERFEAAPQGYAGVVDLLRRAKPQDLLLEKSRWPDENEDAEASLRDSLRALKSKPAGEVRESVLALEREHGKRRHWVWARLGHAPLAAALEPLARLARCTSASVGGESPRAIAEAYFERGWEADDAALFALAAAPTADEEAIQRVVQTMLEPWSDDGARALQRAIEGQPLPDATTADPVAAHAGECIVFVDGLRLDVARRLTTRLRSLSCEVEERWRWAALPTATATAKPAATPVAGQIAGGTLDANFTPTIREVNKPANAQETRKAIAASGCQVLGPNDNDADVTGRGWLEVGEIDKLGHNVEAKLPRHLDEEVEKLAMRVRSVLDAGWQRVRIVTDHGWLLLPLGLPRQDLPKHLTANRLPRFALPEPGAAVEAQTLPWHWNRRERFATPSGIRAFNYTPIYSHGGVSPQECVTPDLRVSLGERSGGAPAIRSITWKRFRANIEAANATGLVADIRVGGANGQSVVANRKPVEEDGHVSLVLSGDEHEKSQMCLVLLDAEGRVTVQRGTKLGEDS